MNKNIFSIFFLILILASVFAATYTITDFNINNNESITNSTTATLYINLGTIDSNCQMCYSEDSNQDLCAPKATCESGTKTFTLSSTNGPKTVHLFLFNNSVLDVTGSDTINLDTNAPNVTITGVNDGNYYTTREYNITITATENTAFDYNSFTFSESQIFVVTGNSNTISATLNLTNLLDGTYTITYDLNDTAKNRTTGTISWIIDSNAPICSQKSSSTFWTNSQKPNIPITDYIDVNHAQYTLNSSNAKISLKCKQNTGTWFEQNYATSTSDFNIVNSTYDCNTDQGYKMIFIKFRDGSGNWSNDSNFTIGYDITNPSRPTGFGTVAANARGTLSWTAPSADDFSGNKGYKIYKNQNGGSYTLLDTITNLATLTKEYTSLTNGTTYCYKLSTYDNAGNESTQTTEACITPASTTATISIQKNNENFPTGDKYTKNGDIINVDCSYSESASGAKMYWAFYTPNTTGQVLDESSSSVTSLSEDLTINAGTTKYAKVGFWCEATGSSGSGITYVYLDNNAPSVSWIDSNNTFVGVKRVTIKANDDKALNEVELDFNNVIYSTTKDSNNNYYVDLNTKPFENGNYALKATATDKAGNKTEISKTVTLDNYLSPKQLAEKAINEAKVKQKTAIDLVNYYRAQALVIPTDLNAKNNSANTLLATAMSELLTQPEKAQTDAISASSLFDEFNLGATTQVKETKTYTNDLIGAIEILQKYGLSAIDANAQIATMQSSGITRKLIIIQTGTSANRQIKIELSFTNDTNSDVVKIVEVIPKEFIDSASKIVSDANFRIIKDDPIVEFTVNVAKGSTATISYGIGELEPIKAQEMIDKNIITLYETAPIILEGNLTTETTMKNLSSGNEFLLLIAGLLVILILIAAIALFIKFKAPGHGFGEEKTLVEHLTPEQEAAKKKFEAFKK